MRKIRTTSSSPGLAAVVKAAATLAIVGCGFHPSGGAGDGDAAPDDGATGDPDAPTATDGRPPIDAPPGTIDAPASTLCADGDPALRVCMPFDDGTTTNLVTGGIQPSLTTAVTRVVGKVGTAAGLSATSALWFAEDPRLDVAAPLTIDMFVFYAQDPPMTGASSDRRTGILDNNGQYSIFLGWHQAPGAQTESVTPYCNINATAWGAPISRNAWHHVACVHTGATLTVYTDGQPGMPVATTTAISTAAVDGTTLGQNCDSDATTPSNPLVGGLDEVRLWTRALTPTEIATAALR